MNSRRLTPCLTLLLLTVGCAGPNKVFVQGERAVYGAIADEHLRLTDQDPDNNPTFTPEQSALRARTVDLWNRSISEQEKALTPLPSP
jgi:hypothetical protein